MPFRHLIRTVAIAALVAGPVAAAAQPTVVAIELKSFSYTPSPIRLHAGQPVTLTFTNRAGGGHDFTAKTFFQSAKILSGNVSDGEVEVGAGQSVSVTLVPAAGHYPAHCGHMFHQTFGMKTEILVD